MAEWRAGEPQSGIHVARSESPTVLRFAFLRRGRQHETCHYAMWGRALTDGRFYPIAPSVCKLALTPLEERNGDTQRYQWLARTHGHLAFSIPIEMQEVVAYWTGNEAHLSVSGQSSLRQDGRTALRRYSTRTTRYGPPTDWMRERLTNFQCQSVGALTQSSGRLWSRRLILVFNRSTPAEFPSKRS